MHSVGHQIREYATTSLITANRDETGASLALLLLTSNMDILCRNGIGLPEISMKTFTHKIKLNNFVILKHKTIANKLK